MIRTELVEKLNRVAPALSSNNLVPILSHFWFKNNTLLAYNDQIAISTKLTTDFNGAIPGSTLTSLLSASRAKEVEFTDIKEGNLTLKAASSKIKLPYLSEEQTKIFEMPKPDVKNALPVNIDAFLIAISSCIRSLKEDTSMPDSLGITLKFHVGLLKFYATNDATISYAAIEVHDGTFDKVVLSGNFCRQMLALSKLDGKSHIEIHADYSLYQNGDTILFGRLIDVQRPLDFDSVIEQSYPKALHKQLVSIPSKIELMLNRAIIITDSKTERPKTAISIKDGVAKFFSSSERGEVRDQVQLEDMQADVEMTVDPRLFKAGLGFDQMCITETCLIMSKGSSLYLVSASA